MNNYDDIIQLPHPVSKKHPPMSIWDRAAQFAPFSALTGYGEAVRETARQTNRKKELDESEKERLREKLNFIADKIKESPEVTITYFCPDEKKDGGFYECITGHVKKIDNYNRIVCMMDGTGIAIEEILEIESKQFESTL
ncbi:MAG: YolD-like family protein [Lachnospiraceae bacterium]